MKANQQFTTQASGHALACISAGECKPALIHVSPSLTTSLSSPCPCAALRSLLTQDDGYAGTLSNKRQPNNAGELGRDGDPLVPGLVQGALAGVKVGHGHVPPRRAGRKGTDAWCKSERQHWGPCMLFGSLQWALAARTVAVLVSVPHVSAEMP